MLQNTRKNFISNVQNQPLPISKRKMYSIGKFIFLSIGLNVIKILNNGKFNFAAD